MVTQNRINFGSGDGLLPDGTNPLSEPIFNLKAISQEILQPSISKISLIITYLKLYSDFPGANELTNPVISLWSDNA